MSHSTLKTQTNHGFETRGIFGFLISVRGDLLLIHHLLTEALLPMGIMRELSEEEMAEYVAPFKNEGEDRRPTLTFPREIPIEGHPKVILYPFQSF